MPVPLLFRRIVQCLQSHCVLLQCMSLSLLLGHRHLRLPLVVRKKHRRVCCRRIGRSILHSFRYSRCRRRRNLLRLIDANLSTGKVSNHKRSSPRNKTPPTGIRRRKLPAVCTNYFVLYGKGAADPTGHYLYATPNLRYSRRTSNCTSRAILYRRRFGAELCTSTDLRCDSSSIINRVKQRTRYIYVERTIEPDDESIAAAQTALRCHATGKWLQQGLPTPQRAIKVLCMKSEIGRQIYCFLPLPPALLSSEFFVNGLLLRRQGFNPNFFIVLVIIILFLYVFITRYSLFSRMHERGLRKFRWRRLGFADCSKPIQHEPTASLNFITRVVAFGVLFGS